MIMRLKGGQENCLLEEDSYHISSGELSDFHFNTQYTSRYCSVLIIADILY